MPDIVPADRAKRTSQHPIVRGAHILRDVGRFRQIVRVAAKHGFGEILERLNLQDSAVAAILARRETGQGPEATSMPERVRYALQDLGPTFVKLGQVASTRPDLVPKEYVDELKLLQDKVKPLPFEEIKETLTTAFGRPTEEVFAQLDTTPVAAASMAQVYKAMTYSGEKVAIKVLRPSAREVVDADIGVMQFLARQLEATFAEAQALNLVGMVAEFEKAVRREMDLRHEARNLFRFRKMFTGRKDVCIPKVYEELCGPDVLVMEFVEGSKITEGAKALSPERRNDLAKTCFDILFSMVFEERLFHGDLHPGNVLLTPDGTVALIDLGLTGRLSPLMRDQLVDLLLAMTQRDWQAVAEAFHEMAVRSGPVKTREFARDVSDMMEDFISGQSLSELELGGVLANLGQVGVRHGMSVPTEYAMMIKAVLTVEGVGKALAPTVDPVEAVKPYVVRALKERYAPERLSVEGVRTLLALSRLTRELPPTFREVMSSVEEGRVRVGVDLSTTQSLASTLNVALGPVRDAVLTGALSIAGAMALPYGEALLLGLPPVSLVLFGLGGCSALRLLLRGRKP